MLCISLPKSFIINSDTRAITFFFIHALNWHLLIIYWTERSYLYLWTLNYCLVNFNGGYGSGRRLHNHCCPLRPYSCCRRAARGPRSSATCLRVCAWLVCRLHPLLGAVCWCIYSGTGLDLSLTHRRGYPDGKTHTRPIIQIIGLEFCVIECHGSVCQDTFIELRHYR